MARIAFCADGTWDSAANRTNVYRLQKAIVDIPGEQYPFYDDGVGCDGMPLEKLAGGACGAGLFQKIKDGYSKISSVYEAGDEIFLFGFSRGAYTARSLAGMIAACGLPTKKPNLTLVDLAFEAYRDKQNRVAVLAPLKTTYGLDKATIRMVGVWDTVGSLGVPAIVGRVDPVIYGFLDTSLDPQILNAFHAVAVDERRAEFPPTLWTSKPVNGQTLKQVYFSGVHCDVGGGYPDDSGSGTALSDITFGWMMHNAYKLGLALDPAALAAYQFQMENRTALDTLHDSWSPFWLFPKAREIARDAILANSITIRCQELSSYRPGNLVFVNGIPGPDYCTELVVR